MKIFKPFEVLYKNKNMIKQTTINDIKARYAGSFLGLAWSILYPVLFLGCYAIIYLYVFKIRFAVLNSNEYVVLIFCGLIPFISLQDALASGTPCVVSNVNLMKNTLFPIEFVPVKTVLSGQTTHLSGMIMILIALAFLGRLTLWAPLFVVLWVLQIMFNIGIVWFLSSLNVVFRDLQTMINILIIILMMISPIAYPVTMVPENLRPFLQLNPLYYIISSYQDVLMFGRFPRLSMIIPFMIMSFASFILGYWFFIKMKRVFVDNV